MYTAFYVDVDDLEQVAGSLSGLIICGAILVYFAALNYAAVYRSPSGGEMFVTLAQMSLLKSGRSSRLAAPLLATILTKVLSKMLAIALVMTPFFAMAADEEDAQGWTNEVELGLVATSGNTDTENLKLRADSLANVGKFLHNLHFDSLRATTDGEITAQKLYAFYQADYKIGENRSMFGRVSYDNDRLSGFNYQADITVGYSQRLYTTETMSLTGAAGAGMRITEFDSGDQQEEPILRLAAVYLWNVSDNAVFQQKLSTEIGNESTVTRSDSSIKATISGSLSMKIALTVKHNSVVPVDRKKTDTETSFTLVYGF
ncbi:MAG: putative salt-induced outer membrane protein [Candidatus Azotimanducaceae bacterium]